MGDLSSLKLTRLLLAAGLLTCLVKTAEATLNILGMQMTDESHGPMGILMGRSKRSFYDDEDCDEYDNKKGPPPKTDSCLDVKPSAWTLSNMYRDQPLFMNFRPRSEEAMLIDNMCFTFFPLPDDQFTYVMYTSTVYRDGSNLIESDIVTDVQLGIFRAANPYCTFKDHVLGYAGCDTFVMYRCYLNNECRSKVPMYTYGLSQGCKQISISCLQKIEDIIEGNGIPEQDYVALPMKLPSECVFEPICTFKGDVHNQVGLLQGELVSHVTEVIPVFEEPAFAYIEEPIHHPVIYEEIVHPVIVEEIIEYVQPPILEPVGSFYTYEGPQFTPAPNKYKPQPRPAAPLRSPYYSKPGPRGPYNSFYR